jgi:hypothetical protein
MYSSHIPVFGLYVPNASTRPLFVTVSFGGWIPPLEPGGVTLELGLLTLPLGSTILELPLAGVVPITGTPLPGATILETSPAFGVTICKLEGAVMLEAESGVMLGGRTLEWLRD